MIRKVLLFCGILASFLYVVTDLLATSRYAGYSFTAQGVSELMAVEAPTRPLLVAFFLVYNLLMFAFAVGVWLSAGHRWALRLTSLLLLAYTALGFVGLLVYPMHVRGQTSMTATDAGHIVVTGLIVACIFAVLGLGAGAGGRWFRVYSWVTFAVILGMGVLSGWYGQRIAAGLSSPGFGIVERVMIYGFLVWVALLGVVLWRGEERGVAGNLSGAAPLQPGPA